MKSPHCPPYRGYAIDVRVVAFPWVDGRHRGYGVSWSVVSSEPSSTAILSLPEEVNFLSQSAAFRYGYRRAKLFIDSAANQADDDSWMA
jgi:hypothetical protein